MYWTGQRGREESVGLEVEGVLDRTKWKRGKCGARGRGCIGQDKLEERYSKPFRRTRMMGKSQRISRQWMGDSSVALWRISQIKKWIFN